MSSVSKASRGSSHASSAASNFSSENSSLAISAIKGKVSSQGTYVVQVESKLRSHPGYKKLTGDKLAEKAGELIDPELILQNFSHLAEGIFFDTHEAMLNDKTEEIDRENEEEVRVAEAEERNRHFRAAMIPLKVTVSELDIEYGTSLICPIGNFLCTDYGAKHVSLTVGDVVIQWGRESLVIPERVEQATEVLADDEVQDVTKYCPHNIQADRKAPATLTKPEDEAVHLLELTAEKKVLFNKLAAVISKYNTKYRYHPVARNCQGFVHDALEALGISKKPPPPKPNERMQEVQDKKDKAIPRGFARHEDLDAFIMKQTQDWIDRLDPDSLEFLQLAYLQFHGDIACHQPTCKANILEDALKRRLNS